MTKDAASRVLGVALFMLAPAAWSQIQFEDVSAATGMTGFTESWGASWGDLNGDNWPDLFVQGHRDFPRAYRNTGEGIFEDVAYEMDPGKWIQKPFDDKHAAIHADFDNDGDEDLLIGVSATGTAQLLVNENGVFTDRAAAAGVSSDSTNRHSVFFDYTGDGFLDLAQLQLGGATLRRQDPSDGLDFDNDHSQAGFNCTGRHDYGQLIDLDNDGAMEFICAETDTFPYKVYDITSYPFQDVTSTVPQARLSNDTVLADFNGDLRYDIVMPRGIVRPSGASLANNHRVEAWLRRSESSAEEKGFSFVSPGQITMAVDHTTMGQYDESKIVVLSPQGPTSGCANVGSVGIVCAEYDGGRWTVDLYNDFSLQAFVAIDAVAPISDVVNIGLDNSELPTPAQHLENSAAGMSFRSDSGLTAPISCGSGTAGDFDNDMDVDLYFVCERGAENLANRLYENQGDGSFVLVPDSGAEGPVGTGLSYGVGDSVVVADYDVDGFLDLFVTNGLLYWPWHVGGPDILLHNKGNGNHWLAIDLQGSISNRDGVGAKVYVTAGGVTQLREQNGGHHRWSQDHQRLHFGLAGNQTANIEIRWPSGTVDVFNGVAADVLYDAAENGALTPAVLGPPLYTELDPGDECGEPPYHLDYGPAVLLWRDCPGNTWRLRARGGRADERPLITAGNIKADAPFSGVTGAGLGGGDSLDNSSPNEVLFSIGAWFGNNKGFNLNTVGQSSSCFNLTTQDIPALIVGSSRKWMKTPFDLVTLGECEAPPPPPPGDAECGDPQYDKASETGLFAWRDCSYGGPEARWIFRVTAGGQNSRYTGQITGDPPLAATAFSIEGSDTLDSSPGDGLIDFDLFVGGSGHDGFQVDVPAGADTCFETSALPPGAEVYVGADRQVMTGAFDLLTLESCGPPPPPQDAECGDPQYVKSSEPGLFAWRDCSYGGPEARWSFRASAGGTGGGRYDGSVTSDTTLGATYFSVEGNDTVDSAPGDGLIDFSLLVGGSGHDGFDVDVPAGSATCFESTVMPAGTSVYVGADRQVMSDAFDLLTLEACSAPPPPPPPPVDSACGAPVYDKGTEPGLFVWRDCDAGGPDQQWHLRMTGGGIPSRYEGAVTSDMPLAATGFSVEASDGFDFVPGDETVEFAFRASGSAQDGFELVVPEGAQTCLSTLELPAGAQIELGAGREAKGSSLDFVTQGACN